MKQFVVVFTVSFLVTVVLSVPLEEPKYGRRQVTLVPLISNGEDTYEGEWPWHAAVFARGISNPMQTYRCGGTLISASLVITAAHCTFWSTVAMSARDMSVGFGEISLDLVRERAKRYAVKEIVRYDDFNSTSYRYDLALLRTTEKVTLSDFVHPIALPNGNRFMKDNFGTVVGWGYGGNNAMNNILQKAKLSISENYACLKSKPNHFAVLLADDDSNFCAGNLNATNVCDGDSAHGGGMYYEHEGTWYLRGLVSATVRSTTSTERCETKQYVTFSNVTFFTYWIMDRLHFTPTNLLNLENCGPDDHDITVPEDDKPIFSQYPWVAVQEYNLPKGSDAKPICSGILIHPQYVLIAGHCVCTSCKGAELKSIRFGDYDLSKNPDIDPDNDEVSTSVQSIPVAKVIHHPKFNNPSYNHNIALIKLARPANTEAHNVKPICLPLLEHIHEDYFVVGWKKDRNDTILSRQNVQIVDTSTCQSNYQSLNITLNQRESIICAKNRTELDRCFSFMAGTPLQNVRSVGDTSKYYLKGVFGFGSATCSCTLLDVYANVSYYLEWIRSVVQG